MPSPGELTIELILLAVVVVVIMLIIKQIWGKNEAQLDRAIRSITRPSFRRGIIMFAEAVAVVQVILFTALGAVLGDIYSGMTSHLTVQDKQSAETFGAFLGGFAGFASSAIFMGMIFAIGAIERNTRRNSGRQPPDIGPGNALATPRIPGFRSAGLLLLQ